MWSRLSRLSHAMKRKLDVSHSPRQLRQRTTSTYTMELTNNERRLRLLLLDVAKSIDETKQLSEPVVLRWAGGWVRDRLLGIPSHDIDVAINNMTGEPFAKHMQMYCDDLLSKPESERKH